MKQLKWILPVLALTPLLMAPGPPGCSLCVYEVELSSGTTHQYDDVYDPNAGQNATYDGIAVLTVHEGAAVLSLGGAVTTQECYSENGQAICEFTALSASEVSFLVSTDNGAVYDLEAGKSE